MSESQTSSAEPTPGDPIEDQNHDGDVVEQAHDALADAEAARAEVDANAEEPTPTKAERDAAAVAAAAMADDDDTPWYDRPEVVAAADGLPEEVKDAKAAETAADAPTDHADAADAADVKADTSTPLAPPAAEEAPAVAVTPAAAPTAIFVQAPEEPRRRGNRAFAGAVGLVAAVIFALVYLAGALLLNDDGAALKSGEALGDAAVAALTSWWFWTPVVVFFLAFWLLGAFLNTAKWGYWVVFGLLVGLAAVGGHALGQIFQIGVTKVTPAEGLDTAVKAIFSPMGLVAFVAGRELPVWLGGWIARRGRKVIAANAEAQEEFQRTIEAGPQLAQS